MTIQQIVSIRWTSGLIGLRSGRVTGSRFGGLGHHTHHNVNEGLLRYVAVGQHGAHVQGKVCGEEIRDDCRTMERSRKRRTGERR